MANIGIDAKIESLRARFEAKLFTSNTYTSYGRAFLNKRDDKGNEGDVPELLTSGNNEYIDVLPDSGTDGHSFFIVKNSPEFLGGSFYSAEVSIYFAVNLRKLYPSINERAVEYLHRDVTRQISYSSPFQITTYEQGLPAFDEFVRVKEIDNMSPYYLVRFDMEIEYNLNCTN